MKHKMTRLILLVAGIVAGSINVSRAQACWGVTESECSYGPFILADCNGEGVTGTVVQVWGGSYYLLFPEPPQGLDGGFYYNMMQCSVQYTYPCNGTEMDGLYTYWVGNYSVWGERCWVAGIAPTNTADESVVVAAILPNGIRRRHDLLSNGVKTQS
jgi:hypothetical protein